MKTSILEIIPGLDLTPEQKAQAMALFGDEKVRGKIDGELKSMQSEFSRGMDEAREIKTKAQADKDAYFGQMTTWRQEQETKITAAQEMARKANETLVQWKTRMEGLTEAGIIGREDWEGLPAAAAAPAPVVAAADPNANKYVTQEEGQMYLSYPALIADIQAEHNGLMGKPLTNMVELVEKAKKDQKPLRAVWEEAYNVKQVRETAAQKVQQEHDDKIRREERTRVTSELTNPTNRPANANYNSPVLVAAAKAQGQNTVPSAGSRQGVERAMAAYSAGKYTDGVVHAVP